VGGGGGEVGDGVVRLGDVADGEGALDAVEATVDALRGGGLRRGAEA
jgi:hypothetical protein